ncbi:MAG: extracellular solute-binding protein [Actinobacteria bacterium]|nr:extracellular solute-binding protein [Actinomycetota bacterium]
MKKQLLWMLIVMLCTSMILSLSLAGCKPATTGEVTTEETQKETKAEESVTEETKAEETSALGGKIVFYHYWSAGSWLEGINTLLDIFEKNYPEVKLYRNALEHEAFKTSIGVSLAGGNPPDAFSYWAGARTQFFVDRDLLMDLTSVWDSEGFDQLFSPETKLAAATYNGKIYSVPISQFPVMMWYNKHVFDKYNIQPPTNWEEFLSVCETLKSNGVTPISLGSKFRWPAQYWFDYLITRTAGGEFRAGLMQGKESYTDPKVLKALELWKELLDKGYFVKDPASYDWAEALGQMVRGEAAMNLMGGWASGSLILDMKQKPVEDYDFFEFPIIDPNVEKVVVGTYDGIVVSKDAANFDNAKLLLKVIASAEAQGPFAQTVGCIAPNVTVSQDIYNEIDKKEIATIKGVPWYHGYDLATDPAVADAGLTSFANFLASPAKYKEIMAEVDAAAKEVFK